MHITRLPSGLTTCLKCTMLQMLQTDKIVLTHLLHTAYYLLYQAIFPAHANYCGRPGDEAKSTQAQTTCFQSTSSIPALSSRLVPCAIPCAAIIDPPSVLSAPTGDIASMEGALRQFLENGIAPTARKTTCPAGASISRLPPNTPSRFSPYPQRR